MGYVKIVDPNTGKETIIDLGKGEGQSPRTVADILAQALETPDDDAFEIEFEEVEELDAAQIAAASNEAESDETAEYTGVRYVAICVESACVTHDLDFTENDDIRDSVREWTHDYPNRISLIWVRTSQDQGWELAETVTSTFDGDTKPVVE